MRDSYKKFTILMSIMLSLVLLTSLWNILNERSLTYKANSFSEENSTIKNDNPKFSSGIGVLWEETWGYSTREWEPFIAFDNESNIILAGNLDKYVDICIIKYTPDGTQVWNNTWDKNSHDEPYDVICDNDNNIYIAGRTGPYGGLGKVMILIKLDSSGDEIWQREWSGANEMGARGIALDSSENIYVVGRPDNDDIYLRKYNPNGDLNWSRTWGGTGGGYENWPGVYGIEIDDRDNIYITGRSNTLGAGGQDMILLKYNSTGNLQWAKTWGYSGDERGYSVVGDSKNQTYVSAFSSTTDTLFLVKFDDDGNQKWNKSLGTLDIESGFQMDIDDQDNIYLTGTKQENNDDLFFMILNASGYILRDVNWSTSSIDRGFSIKLNSLGQIYVGGFTTGIGAGQEDILLLKYNNSIYKSSPEIIEFDAVVDVHTEYSIGESPIHVANVSYLRLGYWDDNIREIYIRFNITSIENIASMKLRFIQGGNSALQITDYEIKLSLVNNNWTDYATDMWWDSRPAELGYSVVDTMTVGGWEHEPVEVIFDITELKHGLNDTLFSIFLEPNNLSQIANFFYQPASSENFNTSIHPKLIVEYGYFHSKIHINGNNQFTSENGVSNPSALGTEEDPFIIENWIIDAGGSGSAIFIENTNKHFKIENCSFYNSGSNVADAGMRFYNVSNGIIINNTVSNNGWSGIRLISSVNNTITQNIANNNQDLGIYLGDSNSNNVTYNTCNNNSQWGIELSIDSDDNLIKGNTVNSNDKVGIQITSGCNNNLIYNNSISGNIQLNAKDDGSSNNWDNGSIGNYWGDYTGTDINDDGIGDSEYSISGSASSKDYYPLWDDGSETYLWSDPELISIDSTDTSEYPDIAVDCNGNVHVVWNDNTNDYLGSGTDIDVFYKRWNATSETWTLTEVVSNESSVASEKPKIDVDQNGNAYVVWYEQSDLVGSGSDQDVFYKIWNATINNWTLTGVVSTESYEASNEPDIAIDNAGNVHVVWHDYTDDYLGSGSDEDIFYKRWNATSKTWTITEVVSIGSTGASRVTEIAVDSNGNAHVTWSDLGNDYISSGSDMDIFYRRWNATSKTWTTVELASNPSDGQSYNPEIATDLFGNAHIIWQDFSYDNIYYKNWNATSKIWSSTLIVSSTSNVENPFISTDIYGNVHIVWHNGSSAPQDDEVIYKRWNAFNDTWTNLKIVSTTGANADCSKPPAITSDTNGGTHIVWPDQTLGDNDIYYRKLIIDYGAPEIIINDPIDKEYINEIPKINVSAYDPNFDQLWYKVEGTNIPLTNNTEQSLESSIWDALDEGEFIIYIYASDTRDNVNFKNVTLYKDTESPATTIIYQAVDAPNYISKTTLLNFTSVDIGSGVYNISYKINSGTWTLHTSTFNLNGFSHGNHTIYYYATDNLGNVEDINQSTVFLDLLSPNISFEISPLYISTLKPQYTQNYLQINCSVVDNTTISWVYLRENSTGTFINRSMSLINSNYTYNLDLSPLIWNDTIAFSFYANDSASNIRHFNDEGQDFLIST